MKLKSVYFWMFLFASCFFAFNQIQDNIRPNYTGNNVAVMYFLGVAPNFFPAIGIPALFFVLIPYIQKEKHWGKWFNENKHLTANLISFVGLVGWEFLQTTGRLRFDWNDILFTCIGSLVFHVIWLVTPQQLKNA